jgi:8-oxo-dGTP diphosphatase
MVKNKEPQIRIRAAAIITNKKNELLLVNHVKNGKSYWLFPGGGVEFGEDFETAIKRELKEELCINSAAVGELVFMNDTIYPDKSRHIINMYFRVRLKNPIKYRIKPEGVLCNARYVGMKEFANILFYPGAKSAIISMWRERFRRAKGYMKIKWTK